MKLDSVQEATLEIVRRVGNEIRLATPLGLGKPNTLLNTLYELTKNNWSNSTTNRELTLRLSKNPLSLTIRCVFTIKF